MAGAGPADPAGLRSRGDRHCVSAILAALARRGTRTPARADYFVRRQDGSAAVVDVRADERVKPRDTTAFEVTRWACGQAGWEFDRVGIPAPVLMANVRWLSRYRHPRCFRENVAVALRNAFASPCPLWEGARLAGETLATLPVLFHLLWQHELTADLSGQLMGPATLVRSGSAVGR